MSSEGSGARPAVRPERLDALTGLRFFAALTVMAFHWSLYTNFSVVGHLFSHGEWAVDLFFVLSGFVLYYNYWPWFGQQVRRQQFWAFLWARFTRIYPMYLIALLLFAPVTFYLLAAPTPFHRAFGGLSALQIGGTWLLNALCLQAFVPLNSVQYLWNNPSWSISDEFSFYLLFPFFVALVLRRVRGHAALTTLAVVLFVCQVLLFLAGSALVWRRLGTGDSEAVFNILFRVPVFRVWEFFIGCTLGALLREIRAAPESAAGRFFRRRGARDAVVLAACLGLLIARREFGSVTQLYTPIFAALIFTLAVGPTFLSRVLSHRLTVLLGEASYSLYLLHWIPILLVTNVAASMLGGARGAAIAVAAMLLTIVASVAAFEVIEAPARAMLRRAHVPARGSATASAEAVSLARGRALGPAQE